MGVAEGTKLSDEYVEMEKVSDSIKKEPKWPIDIVIENGWYNRVGRWTVEQD